MALTLAKGSEQIVQLTLNDIIWCIQYIDNQLPILQKNVFRSSGKDLTLFPAELKARIQDIRNAALTRKDIFFQSSLGNPAIYIHDTAIKNMDFKELRNGLATLYNALRRDFGLK